MLNLIFYDTETSGLNKMFGQIFQFAAILTDQNFQVLDQFEIRSRRMPHIVPDPGAMLVTGVTPEQLENAPNSYYEFASKIRTKMLEWSPAIFCGYNIFSFDEPFMRSMYYQNLYPPYISQTNGNKRMDVLPLVRASEPLFPNHLNFHFNEKGKTSKKLEDVASANGFINHNAHDAMGDVLATIHVAELLKDRTPLLWENGLKASNRAGFNSLIDNEKWFVAHDHNNGWPVTYPAIELCKVDSGRNSLLYDLRYPANKVFENQPVDNFKGRNRPFRLAESAKMPLVFNINDLSEIDVLGSYDHENIDALADEVRANQDIVDAAQMYSETRNDFEKSPHIEAQIYDDFDAFDRDKYLMEDFHLAQPEEKLGIAHQMSDERFRSFARRIIFENFPEQMNADQIKEFSNRINDRINESDDSPWTTKQSASEQCDRLIESHEDTPEELMSLKHYIANL